MEITSVDSVHLGGSATCVRIRTDAGVDGYGEASVETAPEATLDIVERLGDRYLVGRDPTPIAKLWQEMGDALWYHQGPVANGALTGIEHALWDIKGKDLGVPVYELLGGPVREEVRTYKWIGADSRNDLPDQARERVDQGFDAIKFSPTPDDPPAYPQVVDEVVEVVSAVRAAVGPNVDLMLDPASRWKLPEAKHVLEELERYDPLFAEDFIAPEHVKAVEKLADSTRIPYALGDRLTGLREFEPVVQRDAAAVLQPDICHVGGLSVITNLAGMAEHHGMRIAPHNPQGPIATAAAVHVDLSVPNFLIQEVAGTDFFGAWDAADYLDTAAIEIEDGYIQKPSKPGLGIEVDDALFEDDLDVPNAPLFVDRSDFHVPEW
ncbi:galactonate dehydratase [Halobellus limi]|uniref:Galactonate dehydratase n=1 Tax=Halobellus limi TaxID=699433 RepID=A0A1H6BPT8_9EURY|nr:galactonate dehydratase [Halobellus limi]QCC49392.1 galactonate dehydratase [Halobellus limi]SEG62700.1 galactonate dehydratase [Halobellus limi]